MKSILSIYILFLFSTFCVAQTERIELKNINSEGIEYAPSISADGNTLIFQSNRNGEYQLFEARKNENGSWSTPEVLQGDINTFGEERDLIGGPSITYDGNQIYFFASYKGGLGSEDIYYSNREGNKWSKPINVGAPINSKGYDGFPSISSDGRSIYFIRLNKNIVNELNCYTMMVSHKLENGKWDRPSVLPRPLNLGCEKFPRIMPDNETLIFSSIRSGSLNSSFDLYETKIMEGGKWTTPKPLNFANTEDQDYFATVSSRADLMYLNFKGDVDYDFFSFKIPLEFKPKKVINIQGLVTNYQNSPIGSFIKVFGTETGKELISIESNRTDGSYTIVIPEGQYKMQVSKEGFITHEEDLNVEAVNEYLLLKKNIKLEGIKTKVNLKTHNDLSKKAILATSLVFDSLTNNPIKVSDHSFLAEYGIPYLVKSSLEGFKDVETHVKYSPTEPNELNKRIYLPPFQPEIKISPRNADTDQLMPITLLLKNISKRSYVYTGKLSKDTILNLDFKSIYSVYAIAKNCLYKKDVINFSKQKEYKFLDYPIKLEPIKPGAKLTLKEVYFKSGSAELDDSSHKELAAAYGFLRSRSNLVIEISAHTDNVGSETDNLKLSNDRAQSVVDYLLVKGIKKKALVGKGYGESKPFTSNRTEEGRSKNRRVEFKVLSVN